MRFIMVIAFPCTVGLMVLAKPIFSLLFPGTIDTVDMASTMMLVGAPAIIFYSISTLSNGLLQGINKLRVPVVNAAIALFAHVLLLVFLMMTFRLNIYAVILANTFFSFMVCVLNARAIARYSKHKQEVIKTFLIPLLCSCIMGGVCFGVYKLLDTLTHLLPLSLFVSILVAVLVYAVSIIWMKGLTEEELRRFPKGTALIALAKKFHLM